MKRGAASSDPSSIGNLAVSRGLITRAELDGALEVQREQIRLGQILVDLRLISDEQRDELLLEQRARRGERIPIAELHRFERRKVRRRLEGLKAGFQEAGAQAEAFADVVGALAGQISNGSK